MLQKRILCLALCLVCALGLVGGALALELDCDEQYCFQTSDFSDDETLTGICITGLPDPSAGTVMLGTRVLRPGDILTADQIRQMTFVPLRTEEDLDACVTYLPIYPNRVESDTTMSISIRGKEDKAPVAEDDAMETYKNLPNTGKLKAYDPEEQPLTYSIIRQPKRGTVTVAEDGSFTYTPKKNKVGTDSFTYTATDPAGKVSREATVTIQIMKPTNPKQYTDTIGSDCRFAAEWMKNTGLFVGEQVGGTTCFQPEKTVSRGEFLTMLVKTLDMNVDEDADFTGFIDEAPNWLKPYLAAALRSGMTENWPDSQCFGASQSITGAEAALLVQNALNLPSSIVTGKETDGELPVWAETAVAAMSEQGIELDPTAELTRQTVAMMLYDVSKLANSLPNSEVY
jgi:hypothetical protein